MKYHREMEIEFVKCLLRYQWVKLPRTRLPAGKGVMGYWARLAAKAAFCKWQAKYGGHINEVIVGTWSGGMVGLKSILGLHNSPGRRPANACRQIAKAISGAHRKARLTITWNTFVGMSLINWSIYKKIIFPFP